MIILGIDPGTQALGFGIVERKNSQTISYINHGHIKLKTRIPFNERLGMMAQRVSDLFKEVNPDMAVIEKIFLGRNVDSAFKLGHIRGICIYEGQKVGAEIFEYTPRVVKRGITGSGSATKEQVQMLLNSQLGLTNQGASFDASDALSLAFYHATQMDVIQKLRKAGMEL